MARNLFKTLIPVGRESRLDLDGDLRAIAPLADGSLAVLFQGPSGPLDSALQLQRFSATGRPLGPAAGVGPTGAPEGAGAAEGRLTPLTDGGVVATWITAFSHSLTPQFARFDAAGAHVSTGFGLTGQASSMAAAALPGGFATAEAASDLFGQVAQIVLQRFTAGGASVPTILAAREDPFGGLFYNDLQLLSVGDALQVLWTSREGVHAARVGADGAVTQTLLSEGFAADLDTARLADGRIVATWAEPDGAGAQIRAAVFDPAALEDGAPPTEITIGRAGVFSDFAEPEVVALRGGGWAVSWRDGDPDGGTLARTFGPQGGASAVFQAHGDFVGTDAGGRVLSARVDADGEVFVARYNVVSAPFWIPGLDRLPVRQIGPEPRAFDTDWAF